MDRNEIARKAFWGGLPLVAEYIEDIHGYEEDGIHWPSNGGTLEQFITWVSELDDDTLEFLVG